MLKRISKWKKISLVLITIPSVILTYIGLWGFLLTRISVEPPEIVEPDEPYAAFFKVQNLGNFSLYDIFYTINIKDYYLHDDGNGYLDLSEKEGEWFSYGPVGRIKAKPILKPQKLDTPSMEFTTNTFAELCKDGQEMILTVDYRPTFLPFKRTIYFRFQLHQISLNEAKWVPKADLNDFEPNLKTNKKYKGWVILRNKDRIFKSKDRAVKDDQIVLIGLP